MHTVSIEQIEERLRGLSPEKLIVVYDFVSFLAERGPRSDVAEIMRAAEPLLSREWEQPEEDEAWRHL